MKRDIYSIAERNRIVRNIIDALATRERFLLVGHRSPDEDCISSLVAFGLLVSKFSKPVTIVLDEKIHEHFQYLFAICRYNSIGITKEIGEVEQTSDTVVICDTPKPSMLVEAPGLREIMERDSIINIEVDHHLEADSDYIGDPEYSFVIEASSASELVGMIGYKLSKRTDVLDEHTRDELFSRNIVLAILTGIVGDTKMGKFLKSDKERRYYEFFSEMYEDLLAAKTVNSTNFASMEEVYEELERLSTDERECYDRLMEHHSFSENVGYVLLDEEKIAALREQFSWDTIGTTLRAAADELAEQSGFLSLVGYWDSPERSDLVQFRARRSEQFRDVDLRDLLTQFEIENGGGHAGAIGFRAPKDQVGDLETFSNGLLKIMDEAVEKSH
jgi:nanoRNase/pAp phosphatase (c-di-AMP/oligoRNAs hydrolase)